MLADALIDKSDGNAADQFDFGCDSSSSDTAIDDVNHVSINKSIASSVKTRRKKPPSKSTSEESDIQPKHKHDTKISKQTSGGNTSLIHRIRSRRSIVKDHISHRLEAGSINSLASPWKTIQHDRYGLGKRPDGQGPGWSGMRANIMWHMLYQQGEAQVPQAHEANASCC